MKSSFRLLIFCFALFLTGINAYSQTYSGKQKHIDQILENIGLFSRYYMEGDVQSLVNAYTDDGKIFPGNLPIIEGMSGLEEYWTIPEGVKIVHHKIKPEEIKVIKKYAYDYGYYEGATLSADGKKSTWQGKYVIVWKKVGKDWKIYLDIWNRVKNPNDE
jgi:ketosteroid isomerase-like protein